MESQVPRCGAGAGRGAAGARATQLRDLPVDVLPEFSPPTVEIQTEALGLSAAEVEQLITVPLEQDLLNGVAWLDTIRSESIPGLSRVELIFEPGTDLLRARQVVQERLTQGSGAGLGLAIVEVIARAHGGSAHAANLAAGADVWVELPGADR